MRKLIWLLALSAVAQTALALNADDVRGGWETTVGGTEQVFEFSIRGQAVSGVYCTDCSDGTTLGFIDGRLGPEGITFVVRHVRDDGSTAYQDHGTARLEAGGLRVTGRSGGADGGAFDWMLHKDPRGPVPVGGAVSAALPQAGAPAANIAAYGSNGEPPIRFRPAGGAGRVAGPPPWQQPGPWEQLTPAKLAGAWLFATGLVKQYFIIRRVGDQLRGVVCGDCSNPYTMAALDGFHIAGDTLTFNIDHEDWGFGRLPFHNVVTVKVTRNEMRMLDVHQDNLPPQPRPGGFGASLIGPLSIQATAIR